MTDPINLTPEAELAAAHKQLDEMLVHRFDPQTGRPLNVPARIWAFADKEGLTLMDTRNPHA